MNLNFLHVLTLLLIALKLTGSIADWSWWWVWSPLLIWVAICAAEKLLKGLEK